LIYDDDLSGFWRCQLLQFGADMSDLVE